MNAEQKATIEQLAKETAYLNQQNAMQGAVGTCPPYPHSVTQCAREKYWSELSIEEKLERTRKIVKEGDDYRDREIRKLRQELSRLSNQFTEHQHSISGEASIPAELIRSQRCDEELGGYGRGLIGGLEPGNENQVYF